MKECELLEKCIFFNEKMEFEHDSADEFKKQYCLGDKSRCARYIVYKALGREKVPPYLYPDEKEAAGRIIEKG